MTYKLKRQLKRLNDKQFAEDIKRYLKSPHHFYGIKVPEIKTMAKKLHEEHSLKEFYKTFNRLWDSGYHEERSLAIYALEFYEDEFDFSTWEFIKPKLKDINSWDQVDAISSNIIGKIMIKYPELEQEIWKLSRSKDFWMRRMAIVSTLSKIKKGDVKMTLELTEKYLQDKEPYIQRATGQMLREAGKKKPEIVKRFILKHINMPYLIYENKTEKELKELRKVRKVKRLKEDKRGFLFG